MFIGTPISFALASHACEAAWAALRVRVRLFLTVAIFRILSSKIIILY